MLETVEKCLDEKVNAKNPQPQKTTCFDENWQKNPLANRSLENNKKAHNKKVWPHVDLKENNFKMFVM